MTILSAPIARAHATSWQMKVAAWVRLSAMDGVMQGYIPAKPISFAATSLPTAAHMLGAADDIRDCTYRAI